MLQARVAQRRCEWFRRPASLDRLTVTDNPGSYFVHVLLVYRRRGVCRRIPVFTGSLLGYKNAVVGERVAHEPWLSPNRHLEKMSLLRPLREYSYMQMHVQSLSLPLWLVLMIMIKITQLYTHFLLQKKCVWMVYPVAMHKSPRKNTAERIMFAEIDSFCITHLYNPPKCKPSCIIIIFHAYISLGFTTTRDYSYYYE